MKNSLQRSPLAAFAIAPSPPDPVAEAYAEFDRLGTVYGELLGEIEDAKAELVKADVDSIRAAADAYAEGREPRDLDKARAAVEKKLVELKRKLAAAEVAVHEAGNRLADAIGQHRAEWLERVSESDAATTARFAQWLKDGREMLAVIGPARRAVEWVETFNVGQAHAGKQPQFSGGRVRVDTMEVRRETDVDPLALLDVLDQVVEPKERRRFAKSVTHVIPAAARGPR